MKAEEARKLAQENLKGVVIEPLLERTYGLIRKASLEGKSQIVDPLSGLRCMVSQDQRDAVYDKLREDGYKVVHHPDPDPGHPASHAYTTVSW